MALIMVNCMWHQISWISKTDEICKCEKGKAHNHRRVLSLNKNHNSDLKVVKHKTEFSLNFRMKKITA